MIDSTTEIPADQLSVEIHPNNLPHEDAHPLGRISPRGLRFLKWIVPAATVLIVALVAISGFLQTMLWMQQLNYAGIFWTIVSIKWGMTCAAFLGALVFLWINIHFASKEYAQDGRRVSRFAERASEIHYSSVAEPSRAPYASKNNVDFEGDVVKALSSAKKTRGIEIRGVPVSHQALRRMAAMMTLALAAFFALGFYAQWDTYLRFRYGGSYGLSDPIFGVDLGFYLFRLPFYQLLQSSIVFLATLAIIVVCLQYAYFGVLRITALRTVEVRPHAVRHVSVLLFILSAGFGLGSYLDRFNLLYSSAGVVYGVGYTAAHVTMIALWLMIGVAVVACTLLAVSRFRIGWKPLALGIGAYAALYVIALMLAPALVQKFVVQPNELNLETPYLTNYIDFTRKAYNLEAIQETAYPALSDLTAAVIARNQDTIQNIRLWDKRPLLQTYQQTQAIRLYYEFHNVDVDRYHLADGYHQVMLSTRELSATLPEKAQTWVNENLQFTHGYGMVMNFVSKSIGGGFPQFLIQNVPPESSNGLTMTQPAIYFGEEMPDSRIVATGVKEFDYPKGNDNVYTSYHGTGGIPLDSLGKRLLFAVTQGDINILLTSYLRPESRIQIWRNVQERVSKVAPFLKLDADPYAVLSEGKLYWIQDAYTTSNRFPYSNPHSTPFGNGLNYIRNSVKAVVDMYDGTVSFYIMDPNDPVLAVYRRAFPGSFKNLSEMSADLKLHLRYPQDLFAIQATQYQSFHMTDPQVFYNREDLWAPPLEKYDGKLTPMEPYYILMKLPGSEQLEYLLMSPFTPQNRDNMIAWLAARSDFPDYGKMLFYELPKDKLTYGPNQVGAMIDQSTTISQQLTLWDQKGSGVIRGKLVVIPIENSFLYVVPLYLRAEGTNFPQLKRVIVATGDKVVMEPTLDEAIGALFGSPELPQQSTRGETIQNANLGQIQTQLGDAQKALDALRHLLNEPVSAPGQKK